MTWQSSSINPATTSPATDITKITNDLSVLRAVLNGTTDTDVPVAIAGTKIVNTPSGNISATTVQAAIAELDAEKLSAITSAIVLAALGYTPANDTAVPHLTGAESIAGGKRGAITTLTDAATITPDFAVNNNYAVTLGGNRTLANPSNQTAGQAGIIVITQDATGSRTLAFGTNWKFPSGTAPTLTTTASAVDVLAYYVESATRITARLISDVK